MNMLMDMSVLRKFPLPSFTQTQSHTLWFSPLLTNSWRRNSSCLSFSTGSTLFFRYLAIVWERRLDRGKKDDQKGKADCMEGRRREFERKRFTTTDYQTCYEGQSTNRLIINVLPHAAGTAARSNCMDCAECTYCNRSCKQKRYVKTQIRETLTSFRSFLNMLAFLLLPLIKLMHILVLASAKRKGSIFSDPRQTYRLASVDPVIEVCTDRDQIWREP